jgi:hypothetical protein
MIIKIGDVVKWSGQEYLVVGNQTDENSPGYDVQLRPLVMSVLSIPVDEIEEVVAEHSYGSGHVSK